MVLGHATLELRRLVEAYLPLESLHNGAENRALRKMQIWRQPVSESKMIARNKPRISATACCRNSLGHNILILNKISDFDARLYYLRATAQFGWTRNVLLNQISWSL